MVNVKLVCFLLFLTAGVGVVKGSHVFQGFNKSDFYDVMKSGGIEEINNQLVIIGDSFIHEKEAYQGALLMKKAGLVKKPKDKLKFFKTGRIKFETALLSDSNNVEYHFLRLSIQEHAPKIVKYHGQLEKDSGYIKLNFKNLSSIVQQAILDYSKTSKVLHPRDFQHLVE